MGMMNNVLLRDTLEQIDISHILIKKYSDVSQYNQHLVIHNAYTSRQTFQTARTSKDIRTAIRRKKIASLIGVEGSVAIPETKCYLSFHSLST